MTYLPKSEIEIPNQKTGQPTEPFTSTPAQPTRLPEVGMSNFIAVYLLGYLLIVLGLAIFFALFLRPEDLCDRERRGKNCTHRPGECDKGEK